MHRVVHFIIFFLLIGLSSYAQYDYKEVKNMYNDIILDNNKINIGSIKKKLENDLEKYPNNPIILNYLATVSLMDSNDSFLFTQKKLYFEKFVEYADKSWEKKDELKGQKLVDYLFTYGVTNSFVPKDYNRYVFVKRALFEIIESKQYLKLLSNDDKSMLYTVIGFIFSQENRKEQANKYIALAESSNEELSKKMMTVLIKRSK